MNTAQAKRLIETDDDFVLSKRFNFSLAEVEKHYEVCPDSMIAAVLMVTEDDVEDVYNCIVAKLRRLMGAE